MHRTRPQTNSPLCEVFVDLGVTRNGLRYLGDGIVMPIVFLAMINEHATAGFELSNEVPTLHREVSSTSFRNEAPRSKLRGITELNSEDFSEGEANPVASYGECQVQGISPLVRSKYRSRRMGLQIFERPPLRPVIGLVPWVATPVVLVLPIDTFVDSIGVL